MTIIRNPQTQVNDIEQGKYQWMQNPVPAARYSEVKEKFEGSQFKVGPTISTYYFWMNTKVAPFDDPESPPSDQLRGRPGGPRTDLLRARSKARSRSCRPGCSGTRSSNCIPHDIDKAKELLKEANPSDMDITVWTDDESPNNEAGEYYDSLLKELGFNTTLKIINTDNYFTVIGNQSTPNLDTGWADWFEDYPHPNDFFQPLLAGESILQTNNGNFAYCDNPKKSTKKSRNSAKNSSETRSRKRY